MTSTALGAALDRLVEVATAAGLNPQQARAEGEQLSAAISEPAVGAYLDWSAGVGRDADAQAYFAAASKGRRWRISPTPLMSQLGNTNTTQAQSYASALAAVITAACTLGSPTPQVAGMAAAATGAQAGAVAGGSTPTSISNLDDMPHVGGLDPNLLAKLQESEDRLKAMEEFTRTGDAAFSAVLDQMRVNQARIEELRNGPLFNVPGGPQPTQPTQPGQVGADGQPVVAGQTPPALATAAEPAAAAQAEAEPERTVDELLAELDELIGLTEVKSEIKRQTAILRVQAMRESAGLKVPTITRHLVFVGNPGTGKTTVARLVAGIYKAVGLLSKGQLVEVDRSELVAGYLGQTALKTAEVCASALGGVLFIDEAYSLSGDQYGEEAINTLVKEMEDKRDDLVVIVAGYPAPMAKFIAENPGLTSRFRTTIDFANYTDEELIAIFEQMVTKADYDLAEGALDAFVFDLSRQVRDATFGNGRYCRNMLEAAIGHQAWRLKDAVDPTVEQLRELLPADILGGAEIEPGDNLAAAGASGDHELPDAPAGLVDPVVPADADDAAAEESDEPDEPRVQGQA